jgi:hypothetical protein
VPLSHVSSLYDFESPYCAFCWRDAAEHGWLHVLSQRLVCTQCLTDPDDEDGAAGRRAAERVAAIQDPLIW